MGQAVPVYPTDCVKQVIPNKGLTGPIPCRRWNGFTRFAVCVCPGVLIEPPLAVTVNGVPDTIEMMPESFHPPNATEVKPRFSQRFPLPNGNSYVKLSSKFNRRSKSFGA